MPEIKGQNREVWLNSIVGGRGGINYFTDGPKFTVGVGVYSKHLNLSITRIRPDHSNY